MGERLSVHLRGAVLAHDWAPLLKLQLSCRPDYRKLGVLKQQFPDVPVLALTATATQRVSDDLQTILRITGCDAFRSSVNRPNLNYQVHDSSAGPVLQGIWLRLLPLQVLDKPEKDDEVVRLIVGWVTSRWACLWVGLVA